MNAAPAREPVRPVAAAGRRSRRHPRRLSATAQEQQVRVLQRRFGRLAPLGASAPTLRCLPVTVRHDERACGSGASASHTRPLAVATRSRDGAVEADPAAVEDDHTVAQRRHVLGLVGGAGRSWTALQRSRAPRAGSPAAPGPRRWSARRAAAARGRRAWPGRGPTRRRCPPERARTRWSRDRRGRRGRGRGEPRRAVDCALGPLLEHRYVVHEREAGEPAREAHLLRQVAEPAPDLRQRLGRTLAPVPRSRSSPASGASTVARMRSRVVFPAPLGPRSPVMPGCRARSTPSRRGGASIALGDAR